MVCFFYAWCTTVFIFFSCTRLVWSTNALWLLLDLNLKMSQEVMSQDMVTFFMRGVPPFSFFFLVHGWFGARML